jgi:TetR/AcrR family transcriptional regulator, regulator of biofilm formation and stress response
VTDRREEILRAALRLIGSRGMHGITHRDVAAEADVPLGSTTYYFATKEELLREALRLFVAEESARMRAAAQRFEGVRAEPEQVVDAIVAEIGDTLTRPVEQVAQFELYLEATRTPQLADVARESFAAYEEIGVAALRSAGASDPERLAPLFLGLIEGLMFRQLVDPRSDWVEGVLKPRMLELFRAVG